MPQGHPLPEAQLAEARDVGRRMRDALLAFLNALPPDMRTASAMTTGLRIEGVVARRIIRAAAEDENDLVLLTRLPSVQNLRKALAAATARDLPPDVATDLSGAIDAFEALSAGVGGRKANLTKRIRASLGADALPSDSDS